MLIVLLWCFWFDWDLINCWNCVVFGYDKFFMCNNVIGIELVYRVVGVVIWDVLKCGVVVCFVLLIFERLFWIFDFCVIWEVEVVVVKFLEGVVDWLFVLRLWLVDVMLLGLILFVFLFFMVVLIWLLLMFVNFFGWDFDGLMLFLFGDEVDVCIVGWLIVLLVWLLFLVNVLKELWLKLLWVMLVMIVMGGWKVSNVVDDDEIVGDDEKVVDEKVVDDGKFIDDEKVGDDKKVIDDVKVVEDEEVIDDVKVVFWIVLEVVLFLLFCFLWWFDLNIKFCVLFFFKLLGFGLLYGWFLCLLLKFVIKLK